MTRARTTGSTHLSKTCSSFSLLFIDLVQETCLTGRRELRLVTNQSGNWDAIKLDSRQKTTLPMMRKTSSTAVWLPSIVVHAWVCGCIFYFTLLHACPQLTIKLQSWHFYREKFKADIIFFKCTCTAVYKIKSIICNQNIIHKTWTLQTFNVTAVDYSLVWSRFSSYKISTPAHTHKKT